MLKWNEAKSQVDKFSKVNVGDNKQVTGVFEHYNYNMAGNIDFSNNKNNFIVITNNNVEATGNDTYDNPSNNATEKGENSNGNTISNKGAFYETFHYDMALNNPPDNITDNYQLLFIPGAGDLTLYDENGKPLTAKPGNSEKTGITMPITLSKDSHITFDYTVEGGSSLPVYVLIVPKTK